MATRYWVGGAGTWDAATTTNWSDTSGGAGGFSAPTSIDNAIFDAASNATAYAVTVSTNATCNDLTVAGPLVGNVTFSLGATAVINCYGSMTLPATGITWAATAGCIINFLATTTGKTFTTNGISLAATSVDFKGVGGEWTLGSALTTTRPLFVTNGSFITNNFNVTTNTFESSNTNIRSISLGSSTLTHANWYTSITTNLTFNAGTSTIVLNIGATTFSGGGFTFYNLSFTSSSVGTRNLIGENTFNNLSFSGLGTPTYVSFFIHNNQTVNNELNFNGVLASTNRKRLFLSNVLGVQRTITVNGTVANLINVDFRDIIAAGTFGGWSGTYVGDCKNNSNITFDAPKTVYRIGSGLWSAVEWAGTSGGAPSAVYFPLAQDTIVFDNNTASGTHTIQWGYATGTLDCSAATSAISIVGGTTVYQNLILDSDVTITGTWGFLGQGTTQQITGNGSTFSGSIVVNNVNGIVQLQDNFTLGSTFTTTLTSGSLDLNNQTLSTGIFNTSNSNVRSVAFGTGAINLTGNATNIWVSTTSTNFTYTGTPTVNLTYSGAVGIRNIFATASAANALNFNVTAGTDRVIFQAAFTYGNINYTGFAGTTDLGGINIGGDLTLVSGVTVNASASAIVFNGVSKTQRITSGGVTLDMPFTFNGVGSTFQLQDNLTSGITRVAVLTNGTLDLTGNGGNWTFTVGLFQTTNSNVRAIAFGTGNITVIGVGFVWLTTTATNFSRTGTPTINVSNNSATAATVSTGAMTAAQALDFNFTTGTYALTEFTTTSVYRSVNFTGFAGTVANNARIIYGSATFDAGMTLTAGANTTTFASTSAGNTITSAGKTLDSPLTFDGVGGVWTCQDALTLGATRALTLTNGTLNLKSGATSTVGSFVTSGTTQKYLGSSTPGTQATISDTAGSASVSYLTIQDSNAVGGASWLAYAANNNVDAGNNTNWDFGETPVLGAEYTYKLRSFTQPRRF